MKPVVQDSLCFLYTNLVETGTRRSKEDLGFMSNSLLKCKRRNKVCTFCVLSKTVRPPHCCLGCYHAQIRRLPTPAAAQPTLIIFTLSPQHPFKPFFSAQIDCYTCLCNYGRDA